MSNFIINFASTEEGFIKIENLSTACVIKVTISPSEPEMGDRVHEVFMDYRQFSHLVKAIENVANSDYSKMREALQWTISELEVLNEEHGQDERINVQLNAARECLRQS